jgi:hypothetical protein
MKHDSENSDDATTRVSAKPVRAKAEEIRFVAFVFYLPCGLSHNLQMCCKPHVHQPMRPRKPYAVLYFHPSYLSPEHGLFIEYDDSLSRCHATKQSMRAMQGQTSKGKVVDFLAEAELISESVMRRSPYA